MKKKNKIRKKLLSQKGMSLGEMLVAMLIILLVTSGVATGISLAVKQYDRSMIQSESKILYSTLQSVITSELANTGSIKLAAAPAPADSSLYPVESFFSRTYAIRETDSGFHSVYTDIDGNFIEAPDPGYGEIMLGGVKDGKLLGKLLISHAAYSTYNLGAKVAAKYDTTKKIFHIELSVSGKNNYELSGSFDVIPLNDLSIS